PEIVAAGPLGRDLAPGSHRRVAVVGSRAGDEQVFLVAAIKAAGGPAGHQKVAPAEAAGQHIAAVTDQEVVHARRATPVAAGDVLEVGEAADAAGGTDLQVDSHAGAIGGVVQRVDATAAVDDAIDARAVGEAEVVGTGAAVERLGPGKRDGAGNY